MAKMNLSKGLQGRLIGSMAGGATSAVYDKYIAPMLGETVNQYANYVKVGLGVALPMIIKGNQLVTSVSDSLIAIGTDKIIKEMLGDEDLSTSASTPATAGVNMVGTAPFPQFREYTKAKKQAKSMNVG